MRNMFAELADFGQVRDVNEAVNRMKQVIQEIILCALSRGGFFRVAAFYGGTSLRLLYGLERFSEDLDFSLLEPNPSFSFVRYFPVIRNELAAYGIDAELSEKVKSVETTVKTARMKAGVVELLVLASSDQRLTRSVPRTQRISVKFEVDTDPPAGFRTERRIRYAPVFYELSAFDPPSLLAGKISAVLCRRYLNRVKGRDLFDLEWYVRKGIPVNLEHLDRRLRRTGCWESDSHLDLPTLRGLLHERFSQIDYDSAREDVRSFIEDIHCMDGWCAEHFDGLAEGLRAADYTLPRVWESGEHSNDI